MEQYFYELAGVLKNLTHANEMCLCHFQAEDADYVRFNQGRIRQAGSVRQRTMHTALSADRRQVSASCSLTGSLPEDTVRLHTMVRTLRAQRAAVKEDPHIHYAVEVRSSSDDFATALPDSTDVVGEVVEASRGIDLVGLWASGVSVSNAPATRATSTALTACPPRSAAAIAPRRRRPGRRQCRRPRPRSASP